MSRHFWILEVNSADEQWEWRAEATGRGGLDVIAYRTKREATADLYNRAQIYGKSRLVKYAPLLEGRHTGNE